MLATLHIPAYHAGKDFPAREVTIDFKGYPPEGLQISVVGQDADGTWCDGLVEVVKVRIDPGWILPRNEPADDGRYPLVSVFTNWVTRPRAPGYRGR